MAEFVNRIKGVLNIHEAQEIHIRKSKEYRLAVKARLKELIKEGDEDAEREYSRLFPKRVVNDKDASLREQSYIAKPSERRVENIPYIVCRTCGKISDRVQEYEDPNLRHEHRKTWKRTIKPNLSYYIYESGNKRRNRRLFFAYNMMPCIERKHKLQIKFRENKTIVAMKYDYVRASRAK